MVRTPGGTAFVNTFPLLAVRVLPPAFSLTLTVACPALDKPQANRQSEPHAHAIVLDPYFGKVAFIPDLGMVRERETLGQCLFFVLLFRFECVFACSSARVFLGRFLAALRGFSFRDSRVTLSLSCALAHETKFGLGHSTAKRRYLPGQWNTRHVVMPPPVIC